MERVVAVGLECQNCGTAFTPDDSYCEVCGLHFATEQLPEPPAPAAPARASSWAVVIAADREYFEGNRTEGATPLAFPEGLQPREILLTGDQIVVGRSDEARGFFPDIDLSRPVVDPGVSRRHAILDHQPDGSWTVTDAGSTNGTRLNDDPRPITPREPVRLDDGDRIYIGAFVVLSVRHYSEGTN